MVHVLQITEITLFGISVLLVYCGCQTIIIILLYVTFEIQQGADDQNLHFYQVDDPGKPLQLAKSTFIH